MDLKRLMRSVGRGEKGFTLIELLVVVAILGVIAAVVVLNIGSFIGSGKVEAANTEAHQVVTAAVAYMADGNAIAGGTTVGPDSEGDVAEYLLNPSRLQATYTLNTSGNITSAEPEDPGEWSDLDFEDGAWG